MDLAEYLIRLSPDEAADYVSQCNRISNQRKKDDCGRQAFTLTVEECLLWFESGTINRILTTARMILDRMPQQIKALMPEVDPSNVETAMALVFGFFGDFRLSDELSIAPPLIQSYLSSSLISSAIHQVNEAHHSAGAMTIMQLSDLRRGMGFNDQPTDCGHFDGLMKLADLDWSEWETQRQ